MKLNRQVKKKTHEKGTYQVTKLILGIQQLGNNQIIKCDHQLVMCTTHNWGNQFT